MSPAATMIEPPLRLDPCFGKLGLEIERFANQTRRLVGTSRRYRAELLEAEAWSAKTAPLTERPTSPVVALRAIDKFARTYRVDRPALMGAYFAHHHLRAQAELSRTLLRRNLDTSPGERTRTARAVYARAEAERERWISALLELTIQAAAPELSREDYAAFSVGALTDHEDVDLALVASSSEVRDILTRSFSVVGKTFLRFASKVQLFLTEELETPRTVGLVEEYDRLLDHPFDKLVAATQLLGAQRLAGSERLARSLEARVTRRFYAAQGDPRVHQAYLRAVMTELRHHLCLPNAPGVMSPKKEVYVPSKLVITAMRLIHGVHEPRPTHALELLRDRDPEHAEIYASLLDTFAENEVLRALLFLYVMHSDQIDLGDETIRQVSRRVARLLGLGRSPRRRPERQLLEMYADLRARTLRSVAQLSLAIATHLGRVSMFSALVSKERELTAAHHNFVLGLDEALEHHRGGIFWDEVVELFASRPLLAERFVFDFARIDRDEQRNATRRCVRMMSEDAASLLEFLVLLTVAEGNAGRAPEHASASAMFFAMTIELLVSDSNARQSFAERLDAETRAEALHRLAGAFPPEALAALADLFDVESERQSARVARAIRAAMILVHHSSNALARLSSRVFGRAPELIERIPDARRMTALAAELQVRATREPVSSNQLERIGDAFDVASLRSALLAILEGRPSARDAEYTQSVDQYVRELFQLSFRDVHARSPAFAGYRPSAGLALYATGGFGRGEAFGADWDYIAVVQDDDPDTKTFFGKVLQRVSASMARRGLVPHNRFTDQFNAYVVSIAELEHGFQSRAPMTFIDEAEVLEARFVLGDPAVERLFTERVHQRVLRENARAFVQDILHEIEDRRSRPPEGLSIKLNPGGLREIHLIFLAIRVVAQLPGRLVPALLPEAERSLPSHRGDLRFLLAANEELRRARELYRLVVAIDDTMEPELLTAVAKNLPSLASAGIRDDYGERLRRLMDRVARRIDAVTRTLRDRIADAPTA